MSEKSPTIAVLWSFLFTGIGLVYLGDKTKGIMFFAIGVLFNIDMDSGNLYHLQGFQKD